MTHVCPLPSTTLGILQGELKRLVAREEALKEELKQVQHAIKALTKTLKGAAE
ncbi:MAG TPA: hypothetical protein VFF81_06400 [Noviherbaspirillum sp.]|nr:hypothetical protein [Noviherbaspirillum sp.]